MSDSVSADPRIGSELAGYRIERLLGRGGMSMVYLAHDPRLDRRVALKLLSPELAEDERFRERFLRESQLAASLDHPNVIPIFEAGESEGVLFIAMRYVEGTDLKKLLVDEGRLDPARAVGIVDRVASALDAAHEQGLVHRDVKPANVLIAQRGGEEHVYLSDFGLTKQQASESGITETGQFMGTADYVSPEQIEHRDVSGRSDEYALACVLYECLTGTPPFRGESLMGVLWGHMNREATPATELNAELPAEIDVVLARGMAKEPQERHATCGELAQDARGALGLSGELTAPAAVRERSRRRGLIVAALMAILLVVVAVVLAVVLTGGGGDAAAVGPVTADSLVRLDSETGEVAAVVPVGSSPEAVAIGDDVVIAANRSDGTVSIVDRATDQVRGTVAVSGRPLAVAAAGSDGWVASTVGGEGVLTQLDLDGVRVRRTLDLGFADPVAVAVGEGAVWVAAAGVSGNAFLRVDPATLEIVATIPIDERPEEGASLVAGHGGVWSGSVPSALIAGAGALEALMPSGVLRIDPDTNEVETVALPTPESLFKFLLVVGPDAVWAAQVGGHAIWRIDPTTNGVTDIINLDQTVGCTLVGDDFLWHTTFGEGLRRVDPETEETIGPSLPDVRNISAVATAPGELWATVADGPECLTPVLESDQLRTP